MSRCPECGAEVHPELTEINDRTQFECESYLIPGEGEFEQSYSCLITCYRRERAARERAEAENARFVHEWAERFGFLADNNAPDSIESIDEVANILSTKHAHFQARLDAAEQNHPRPTPTDEEAVIRRPLRRAAKERVFAKYGPTSWQNAPDEARCEYAYSLLATYRRATD